MSCRPDVFRDWHRGYCNRTPAASHKPPLPPYTTMIELYTSHDPPLSAASNTRTYKVIHFAIGRNAAPLSIASSHLDFVLRSNRYHE